MRNAAMGLALLLAACGAPRTFQFGDEVLPKPKALDLLKAALAKGVVHENEQNHEASVLDDRMDLKGIIAELKFTTAKKMSVVYREIEFMDIRAIRRGTADADKPTVDLVISIRKEEGKVISRSEEHLYFYSHAEAVECGKALNSLRKYP